MDIRTNPSTVLGWASFQDWRSIASALGVLLLATVLGALIGYHPATRRSIDDLEEADMPHVFVMYALVGAVIGVAVREFGTVVGFAVFGIGGLMRFRSTTGATRDTVRLIAVTLIGLIAGLGLLDFAVVIALFAFGLIYVFDSAPPCRIKIDGLPADRLAESADAYRRLLKDNGCKIMVERRVPEKARVEFIFRLPRGDVRSRLRAAHEVMAADLRGQVSWEIG